MSSELVNWSTTIKPVCPRMQIKVRPTPQSKELVGTIKHGQEIEVYLGLEEGYFCLTQDQGYVLMDTPQVSWLFNTDHELYLPHFQNGGMLETSRGSVMTSSSSMSNRMSMSGAPGSPLHQVNDRCLQVLSQTCFEALGKKDCFCFEFNRK